jgi:aminoglycoside phosphotransferase (APT) family kinase protein
VSAPTTPELRDAVVRLFGEAELVARRLHPYRSSFAIEELDLRLGDGELLSLVFKDLGLSGLNPAGRSAKPLHLHDPRREIDVYTSILAAYNLGTATCYGSVVDPGRKRHWLFLERVAGVPLWQLDDRDVLQTVARWLARLHATVEPPRDQQHLLRYDRAYYGGWLRRAVAAAPDSGLEGLRARYEHAVARIATAQPTFVHGELYPSNVLIVAGEDIRVCPVDWELSGIATGMLDVAALTTGLPDTDASLFVDAYSADLPEIHDDPAELLECCRLYLAVQWVARSEHWTSPLEHARDWAAEAIVAAERLETLA